MQEENVFNNASVQKKLLQKDEEIGALQERLTAALAEAEQMKKAVVQDARSDKAKNSDTGFSVQQAQQTHKLFLEALTPLMPAHSSLSSFLLNRSSSSKHSQIDERHRKLLLELSKESGRAFRALLGDGHSEGRAEDAGSTESTLTRVRAELRAARSEALQASEANVLLQAELSKARIALGRMTDDRGRGETSSGLGTSELTQRLVDKEYDYDVLLQQHITTKLLVASVSQDADEERVRVFELTRRLQRYAERVESLEASLSEIKTAKSSEAANGDKKGGGLFVAARRKYVDTFSYYRHLRVNLLLTDL